MFQIHILFDVDNVCKYQRYVLQKGQLQVAEEMYHVRLIFQVRRNCSDVTKLPDDILAKRAHH